MSITFARLYKRRARREGQEARAAGQPFSSCPHREDETARDCWRAGWLEGFELAPNWAAAGWELVCDDTFGPLLQNAQRGTLLCIDTYCALREAMS